MVVMGIFIIGFFYVAFGAIINQFNATHNNMITAGTIPISQDRQTAMDFLFKYWWGFPIYAVVLFVIQGIII